MERGNHAKRAFAGFVYLYDLYSFPYNVTFYRGPPSISTFTSAEIRSRRACALAIARLLQFRREFHRVSVSNRLEAEMPTRWFRRNKTRISPVSILNQLSNNWFSRFVPGSPSVVKHASLWRYVLLGIVGEERERLFLKLNYFDDRCNNLFRYTPDKPVAISNMEESCEYCPRGYENDKLTSLNLDISCEFKVLG